MLLILPQKVSYCALEDDKCTCSERHYVTLNNINSTYYLPCNSKVQFVQLRTKGCQFYSMISHMWIRLCTVLEIIARSFFITDGQKRGLQKGYVCMRKYVGWYRHKVVSARRIRNRTRRVQWNEFIPRIISNATNKFKNS